MKIIKILFVNILITIGLIYTIDLFIYNQSVKERIRDHYVYHINKFQYFTTPNFLDLEHFFTGTDNVYRGRTPDGLEYHNAKPITIFGCSFSHGQHLNKNQTLSYKLAHILKRPVYNRSIMGGGLQEMYEQSKSHYFYKDVPPSDTVIYLFLNDHYRRMLLYAIDILALNFKRIYYLKNDQLIERNQEIPFLNLIKSSYLIKRINTLYYKNILNNPKNADKLTDLAVAFFTNTKKELEQHWHNKVKFYVIFYDRNTLYENILKKKLEQNNIEAISISELTNENLYSEVYTVSENNHPSEATWDLLTPKIIERLNLEKNI